MVALWRTGFGGSHTLVHGGTYRTQGWPAGDAEAIGPLYKGDHHVDASDELRHHLAQAPPHQRAVERDPSVPDDAHQPLQEPIGRLLSLAPLKQDVVIRRFGHV